MKDQGLKNLISLISQKIKSRAEYSSQSNANKRKAESKVKSSPKKRTVELSISSNSDANIDEKDIVQSDPEIDEVSDEETLMIQ